MGWLLSVLVLVAGIVLLLLLLVLVLWPIKQAKAASSIMSIAIAGRTTRIRASVAELRARRDGQNDPSDV
jgi:hypothetical protein